MSLWDERVIDPIGWNTIFKDTASKYGLKVEISTSNNDAYDSLLKEKMVIFTIMDDFTRKEEPLMSLKTRVRGFLKIVAVICPKIAQHFNAACGIMSSSGEKRMAARTIRIASDEERQKHSSFVITEHAPLSAEELWDEYQNVPRGRHPRVIIFFREQWS